MLGCALTASLACNVYVLVDRHRVRSSPGRKMAAPHPGPRSKPTVVTPPPRPVPVPPEVSTLDLEALKQKLADAEARLEQLLPVDEKFERTARSPENELRLQPYLDELFDVRAGAEPNYQLECHGAICKLDSEEDRIDWRLAIQTDIDAIGLFRAREFVNGSAYLVVSEDSASAAGDRLALRIFMSLEVSPLATECKRVHPEPGFIAFALRFDKTTRHLNVGETGSLVGTPGGDCLRNVLDGILATTAVPDDVTTLPEEPLPMRVP